MIKLPKGTQDYFYESWDKLDYVKSEITKLFKKYHGIFVETPVFELTDVLTSKYGEDEKLIFNIESNESDKLDVNNEKSAKEQLSLRYDHTVPLVRFCLTNKITKIRRCCIGKVYRREAITKTQMRAREFFQADFDYVGDFDELVPEIEIMSMIQELFKILDIDDYSILYNYRQNLDHYVKQASIDLTKQSFSTICSSIDKLDKNDKDQIRIELTQKGLTDNQIDKLYENLFSVKPVMEESIQMLDDKFRSYLMMLKTIDMSKLVFTPTLARGSDYYTGLIFEVKLNNSSFTSSVVGGGRYDKLMTSYSNGSKNDCKIIGFSFGIDRLLKFVQLPKSKSSLKIWISTIGSLNNENLKIKLGIVGLMSKYGVFYNTTSRKFTKEVGDAVKNECTHMIIIGETEYANNQVQIKNLITRDEEFIDSDKIVEYFDKIN